MKPLENKVAIVTGASRGIGAATAILLAQAGANVGSTGRRRIHFRYGKPRELNVALA